MSCVPIYAILHKIRQQFVFFVTLVYNRVLINYLVFPKHVVFLVVPYVCNIRTLACSTAVFNFVSFVRKVTQLLHISNAQKLTLFNLQHALIKITIIAYIVVMTVHVIFVLLVGIL